MDQDPWGVPNVCLLWIDEFLTAPLNMHQLNYNINLKWKGSYISNYPVL